jgi:hypothetical protein
MFRTLVLFAVASLAILAPVGLESKAEAGDVKIHIGFHGGHGHHSCFPPPPCPCDHYYLVYYRKCCHSPWRVYDSFHTRFAAERVAQRLEFYGYDARVVRR